MLFASRKSASLSLLVSAPELWSSQIKFLILEDLALRVALHFLRLMFPRVLIPSSVPVSVSR